VTKVKAGILGKRGCGRMMAERVKFILGMKYHRKPLGSINTCS
jgi:hypothetical protein